MSYSLGVLAGMGPRSTAPFIDMLVDECQKQYGARFDIDYPKMHIISLPTPFFPNRVIDDAAMSAALRDGTSNLVNAGVNLIVVPCNMAHCYFNEMQEASGGIPVLHIADCALECLPSETENIAVIATEATLDAGFYQQRLHLMGKHCVASDPLRAITTHLIALIKQNGFTCPEVITQWRNLTSLAQEAGAQGLIIACTDISPLLKSHPQQHLSIVDTASSLAEATIRSFAKARSAQSLHAPSCL
ncbi:MULTISPECIES: aspartate/glutamate racemase family protein [unclassified Tatumella]|uniref:aspartate/glutamate racemase family protein n=1 Tax=unclassified Tatumella TaxID=2649542 RepID=UPI001BB08A9A|nr:MULTISPECIES: aspartate/glutamate racemase family protein [unclassified Tatumella]MBS0855480.1 aspartate/glutamate racemase family protein [Tatumella sp. JGM16]MBS0912257.1 aspartate/glutamate racemase family protein [Tatumella sp. JGM91]